MSMDVEPVAPERRLRIAVVADFEGPHARSWVRWFIARGHEVHTVSFYPPRVAIEGARMHWLRRREAGDAQAGMPDPHGLGDTQPGAAAPHGVAGDAQAGVPAPHGRAAASHRVLREAAAAIAARMPRGIARLAHGARYRMAGLRRTLERIDPDVVHAHYVVEHGFYGALAGVHPLVVTAWGSDVLVEPRRDPISRLIARWTIARADLVTSNNAHMARRIGDLGVVPARVHVVTLGAERYDLELSEQSVNRHAPDPAHAPCIISTRAHEPLYHVDDIIDAHARVAQDRPGARLVVAHGGSLTPELRRRAEASGGRVEFAGFLGRAEFRDALSQAHVFVSVPSSDATSVALLQAMGAGAFPIVSDLPSQREWIRDGFNGFLVPVGRPDVLAERIAQALDAHELRRSAADVNQRLVEERGLNETQMAKMEELYRELAERR